MKVTSTRVWLLAAALTVGGAATGIGVSGCSGQAGSSAGAASTPLPDMSSALQAPPTVDRSAPVHGQIRAPGGPFLYDSQGRVVFFHGVNVVYKLPPYELYDDPGKPWNFDAHDASLMARLGFNVVRLGITWSGLEPGTDPANDPAVCTHGAPGNPGQLDMPILDQYLSKVEQTVDLLGRYHIYTLLDMHQDVYNEIFHGEGAPDWAVCTDGVAPAHVSGRWSRNYRTTAVANAYNNFWTNDVVGDLQGQYDDVWAEVAGFFKNNRWILGYDPFNEPFSESVIQEGARQFDGQLECFYTGTELVGEPEHGAPPITCPPQDPRAGVIPQILAADPNHLVFYEPDIFASHGHTNFLGAMDLPGLVFNVHLYCSYRNPTTGNPTHLALCAAQEANSLALRSADRTEAASARQLGGPGFFVSEFGATSNVTLLESLTSAENEQLVGWTYWSWKYYDDPTGSSDEALVESDGSLRQTARALSETYAEAVAGIPTSMSFDATSGAFELSYQPNHAVHAPTVVFVPTAIHYPDGYCASVRGGRVVSRTGAELLEIDNSRTGDRVNVSLTAGPCR